MRVRSIAPCAGRGSSAAASIFPVIPAQRSIRITNCRSSPARARSWRRRNGSRSVLLHEMDSMMVGHANYPALDDSGFPSSLSRKIITASCAEEWGYRGTVISDDLDMGAIVGHYGLAESVTRAVEAGNDLVLLCHRPELIPEAARALEGIPPARAAAGGKAARDLHERPAAAAPFFRRGACRRRCADHAAARRYARPGTRRAALGG